jgi:amino acid adenylation domain-containing protein
LSIRPVEAESGTARFDLTLEMMESSEGLRGSLEYNTDLFDVDTIARMVGHFQQLLESIATDPAQALSLLPMLSDAEGQQLLVEWNQTAADYPQDRCIHHLFESQVVQRPEAPALIFEEEQLTYRQLNRRANQLAHYLQKLGVGPDTLVGICIERSIEMIVGLLGVLKAGGAYLPLDPTYPAERLAFMLSDSRVPVLLVQERLVERLRHADSGLQNQNEESAFRHPLVICLDADWEQMLGESEQNPTSSVTPESLAYCIYTSGSTGQPKGVMLPHRGLSNLAVVQRRAFNIDAGGRILQFAPFSFDASVWEIFMALSSGATLCLARQESLASMEGLHRLLEEQRITTVTLPPSVLARLSAEELPELKTVIAAGESCPVAVVKRWAPGRRFFNAYGPTETTVCASLARCDESAEGNPPIGRPIANTEVYVLDKRLQPVPIGVPGELHIGGVTLAREYLNRPELTAEKFIRLRIADGGSRIEEAESHSGLRWYKTGDLVRYRPDGNVEFLGRIDHQVKIRGFRVELGEIETVLSRQPGVAEAVVVAREDEEGDKQLVAYVVTAEEAELNGAEVRSALRQQLPEYMVPVAFVQLEAMPLAPSGKVDRAALPAPSGMRSKLAREYLAPRTETERKLAEIWAELLKLDRVGVHDDFFDLGGHSLLATQLVSRVQEAFQVELPLRTLFELPTIAAVAERIEAAMTAELPDSDKIARLLERMEQLSEDEVKAMLDEKELLVQTIDHDRPAQTTQ